MCCVVKNQLLIFITTNKMQKLLVARLELFSLFIAIAIGLCLYMILAAMPSDEIARIILAVAVGYTAANKMAMAPVAKDEKDTSEEENNTNDEVDEVNNNNIVPAVIAFSDESRPALINSSTLGSDDVSIDHHHTIDDSDRVSFLVRQRRRQSCVDEDDHAVPFRIQMESMWQRRRISSLSCTDTIEKDDTEVMTSQDQVSVSQETVTDKTVATNRSSKEKQDDIKLMLGLHSSCSSEESKVTRRSSYYSLARTPKLSRLRNRRKSVA